MKKKRFSGIFTLAVTTGGIIMLIIIVKIMAPGQPSGKFEKNSTKNNPGIEENLGGDSTSIKDSDITALKNELTSLGKRVDDLDNGSLFGLVYFLPLVFILAIVFIFLFIRSINGRISRHRYEIDELKANLATRDQQIQHLLALKGKDNSTDPIGNKNKLQEKSIDVSDLKKQFEQIIKDSPRINELQRLLEEVQVKNLSPQGAREMFTVPAALSESKETKQLPDDVFYMTGPVTDFFPAIARSNTKEETIYKFILKGNKQEANYEVHTSGVPVREIVRMAESYIKPACDEENTSSGNVRNIVTLKPGMCLLEGDKWVIKSKALIRYE